MDEQEKAEGGASHFQNSSAAMDLGQEVWRQPIIGGTLPKFTAPTEDVKAVFHDASVSRRQEKTFNGPKGQPKIRDPTLR